MSATVPVLSIVAVIALALLLPTRLIMRARQSRSWPTVDATVVDARVVGTSKGSRPKIRYRYQTPDGPHESGRLVVGWMWGVSGAGPERIVGQCPKGSTVRVAVDPADPRYSVLLPGLRFHQVATAIGCVFFAMAMALLLTVVLTGGATPVPPEKAAYVGEWQAPSMYLLITQDGSVRYRRIKEGGSSSIDGPLKGFSGNDFEVGIGPLSSTFVVSTPPHRDDEQWKMVVDEVELHKTADHAGPLPFSAGSTTPAAAGGTPSASARP
ncbi:MAG TPA: DUF3592 domain-containing protein [Ideonella sp.]|uniref:DUF3592 domain-containing protein n=1 Tax=Ideonella sp. TaxID=1929293 RepID=UPI002B5848F4|nr:DUF3592 domain-containing protein [Ideonella sp.]HSI51031.1 DUF3592 domain-containing protein [Ideonella sp.]